MTTSEVEAIKAEYKAKIFEARVAEKRARIGDADDLKNQTIMSREEVRSAALGVDRRLDDLVKKIETQLNAAKS